MYLSRLDLFGFKSFAHRTRLDFTEGLTCVIGPNGSGKSNIVDAIRWVLGEQRVSSLRSDKMENVIFNGNKTRKPMGFTEVSMTIENNKKILKTEFDEVVISRRLYRSGESQYLINKVPVRLKDVLNLFMDTGMGANSYSVIELNMVESILSESKQERRQLFEEAAGIVKYKIRRKSALRKLEATQHDLLRLNDILIEVEKNVSTLSRQVSKTRRYLNYTEELKKNELDISSFRYHKLFESVRPLEAQLEELKSRKDTSHRQITIDEALIEDYKRELIATEQKLTNIQNTVYELDSEIARIKQENAVSVTKSDELIKTRERYKDEIQEYRQRIRHQQQSIEAFQEEIIEIEGNLENAMREYEDADKERLEKSDIINAEKAEIDQLNLEFRNRLQSVTREKESLKQKKFQLTLLNDDFSALRRKIQEHDNVITTSSQSLEQQRNSKIRLEKDLSRLHSETASLEKKLVQKQKEQNTLESEYQNLISELEKARSRQNFYEDLLSSYEGHSESTQHIMASRDRFKGLRGPVSDLLSVPEETAPLVEIVLGNALNFLVVDNVSDAMQIIDEVNNVNKGRITCIPLSRLQHTNLSAPDRSGLNIDLLIDRLQYEDSYEGLFQVLLGDVALVESLDDGLKYAETHPALRLITARGETINFNREVSGGAYKKQGSALIGRHDQYKRYTELVKEFEKRVSEHKSRIIDTQNKVETNRDKQKAVRSEIESVQQSLLQIEKQVSQLQYEVNKHTLERTSDEKEISDILTSIESMDAEIKRSKKDAEGIENELNAFEKKLIERTNEFDTKNDDLTLLQQEVQTLSLNTTNLRNQLQNRKNDLERGQQNIEEFEQSIKNRESEIIQIEEEVVQLKDSAENREKEQIGIWEKRDHFAEQKKETDQAYQEIKSRILGIEEDIKKYRKEHDSSIELSRSLELRINENTLKAQGIREQVLKEYSEDVAVMIPFEGLDEAETEERIEVLKARIKNMGPVNPLAVSEHEKEKERLDFLSKQRDDLFDAEKSLLETISKINKTARENFTSTFEKIKVNFERVFNNFFENGDGTIKLVQDQDPLEANIDIEVRTKGRRPQTLSLLSGGEKTLTAISLLFAIYLVKPSPFCILDEVDAPLDDINIKRFTEALQNFSNNTQFIIVTHNKRTMEAARTMYGVTMEEEGVSKLVSVKFN